LGIYAVFIRFSYAMSVRVLLHGAIGVFLMLAGAGALRCQDAVLDEPPPDQFFAGIITALSDTSVTVTRTVLGKESTVHTFAISADTHVEGKPKLKSRVTVRYVSDENGDRAVRIIVRGSATPPKKQ